MMTMMRRVGRGNATAIVLTFASGDDDLRGA
jgi:hypothetical protein